MSVCFLEMSHAFSWFDVVLNEDRTRAVAFFVIPTLSGSRTQETQS